MKAQRNMIFLLLLLCLSCRSGLSDFERFISTNSRFDYHIHNARIMDGTGGSAYVADLLIRGDSIAYIGEVDSSMIRVKYAYDAKGKVLSPGFIDPHSHGDPLRNNEFRNFLAMGVTSICLGQDGYHAPVENLSNWMKEVQEKQPGVNILPFVGHATLREMSGIGYSPDPGQKQMDKMISMLNDAFVKGAWGLTTGLEYRPGFYAKDEELLELAKVTGDYGRMIMSHVRNEDDDQIENSLRELIRQGQYCKVHVSHMKSVYGRGRRRAEKLLGLLDSARLKNVRITADVYPYNASYTGIGIVFPDWALPPNNFEKIKKEKRYKLEGFLAKKVIKRNGPKATLFGTPPYAGKTLEEVAKEKGKSFEKVLIDDIGPSGASAAYFVMNENLQERLLQDPFSMVSSDGSPTMRHPRGYGSFVKIIQTYVLEKYLFSLEEAVYKMTGLTALTLGLEDRGFIKVGNKADILIFDPNELRANATYESPHELATGISAIWLNGKLVMEDNRFVETGNGRVLRAKFKL
ncbi:MAG: amidohydrolase family protein [Bacteroidota bacterium]